MIYGCFPFNVLASLCNSLNQKTCAIVIIQQLTLHLNICFSRGSRIHCIMLIFHFHIYGMYYISIWQNNAIWILINHIPATFFSIIRNSALINILKYSLMKISNIIIV